MKTLLITFILAGNFIGAAGGEDRGIFKEEQNEIQSAISLPTVGVVMPGDGDQLRASSYRDIYRFAYLVKHQDLKKFLKQNRVEESDFRDLSSIPDSVFGTLGYSDLLRPQPAWIWDRPHTGKYVRKSTQDESFILHIVFVPSANDEGTIFIQAMPNNTRHLSPERTESK